MPTMHIGKCQSMMKAQNYCLHSQWSLSIFPYAMWNSLSENRISQMLESIESAAYNQDDIITWGETLDELEN